MDAIYMECTASDALYIKYSRIVCMRSKNGYTPLTSIPASTLDYIMWIQQFTRLVQRCPTSRTMHSHWPVKLYDFEYHLKFGADENQGNVNAAKHAKTFEIRVKCSIEIRGTASKLLLYFLLHTRSKSNSAAQQLARFLSQQEGIKLSICDANHTIFLSEVVSHTQCTRGPGSFITTPNDFCTLYSGQNRGLPYTPSHKHS